MSDETMVLVALPHPLNPVQPHTPGGYILGYVEGDRDAVVAYLNEHKQAKTCARIQRAWILQTATRYQAVMVVGQNEDGSPIIQKLGKLPPGQPLPPEARMQTVTETSIQGLTNVDATSGCDYYIEPQMWVIPQGVMITNLEDHIKTTQARLAKTGSNISLHATMPAGAPTQN